MSGKAPISEENEKRLEEAFAALRVERSNTPREDRAGVSPELQALTGILPPDFDFKKAREEYYDYMAWKHGDRAMEYSEWQKRNAVPTDQPGGRRPTSESDPRD